MRQRDDSAPQHAIDLCAACDMCMCPHEHRPSHVDIYDISDPYRAVSAACRAPTQQHQYDKGRASKGRLEQGVYPWYVFPRTYTSSMCRIVDCAAVDVVRVPVSACVCKTASTVVQCIVVCTSTAVDSERVLERALGDGLSHELIHRHRPNP